MNTKYYSCILLFFFQLCFGVKLSNFDAIHKNSLIIWKQGAMNLIRGNETFNPDLYADCTNDFSKKILVKLGTF